MTLPPNTPLVDAQDWLRKRLDKGEKCPCCTQLARVYRRQITSGPARGLIRFYLHHYDEWGHQPSVPQMSRLGGEFAYWGLIEEETDKRPDGGRAGWWRITPLGEQFVLNLVSVPKWVRVYDGRVLGFEPTPLIKIKDALGKKFDYSELMSGV